jgi:hypothetical protein
MFNYIRLLTVLLSQVLAILQQLLKQLAAFLLLLLLVVLVIFEFVLHDAYNDALQYWPNSIVLIVQLLRMLIYAREQFHPRL